MMAENTWGTTSRRARKVGGCLAGQMAGFTKDTGKMVFSMGPEPSKTKTESRYRANGSMVWSSRMNKAPLFKIM